MVRPRFGSMSALLLTVLGITTGIPHCPMWKDIMPCTCRMDFSHLTSIYCERMTSFEQVVNLFRGHFAPTDRIILNIGYSALEDLSSRSFKELNMSIENLQLSHDDIRQLRPESFEGLTAVSYFSLADNSLAKVPEALWRNMPNIRTLDLGRTKIQHLTDTSFQGLPLLQVVVLPSNYISRMDANCIPPYIHRLHLGRNLISDLNGTLHHLKDLIWLFVNSNNLTTLEGELPFHAPNLKLIHLSSNRLDRIPQHMKTYGSLESLFAQDNLLTGLDGTISRARKLKRLVLANNMIHTVRQDEFLECELLESLHLGHNHIVTLNGSLVNLKNLNFLNLSNNRLEEFSFQEIVGLQELRSIDLSFNKIRKIFGPSANMVEWNIKLTEIKLDNNELETLNGALSGLPELLRLNLSFNKLKYISPDDLIGLEQLRLLDISHNQITSLEKTSETFLPRLEELRASNNLLTILERDFHGLPVLCYADLSSNKIVALGRELVTKTRCKIGHGVHEGTWDTLKIDLQDNPILCDAALPEITTAMEVNHTRIFGVSHCPPLSEQPTTSRPNRFLGYVPEEALTSPAPAAISAEIIEYQKQATGDPPENRVQVNPYPYPYPVTLKRELPIQYSSETVQLEQKKVVDEGNATESHQEAAQKDEGVKKLSESEQISKLLSEIEVIKSQLEVLANETNSRTSEVVNATTERSEGLDSNRTNWEA